MANYGKIRAAFRFGEIYQIIRNMGLKKFISWYVVIEIIYIIIILISTFIIEIFQVISPETKIISIFVASLFINAYLMIYFSRSVGLIYSSDLKSLYEEE